jgi:hypothetical protein
MVSAFDVLAYPLCVIGAAACTSVPPCSYSPIVPTSYLQIKELVGICKEYVIALRCELKRKELKEDDMARAAELAAYFTHCNLQVGLSMDVGVGVVTLQPVHTALSLRSAMTIFFKPIKPTYLMLCALLLLVSCACCVRAAGAHCAESAQRHDHLLQAEEPGHLRTLLQEAAGAQPGAEGQCGFAVGAKVGPRGWGGGRGGWKGGQGWRCDWNTHATQEIVMFKEAEAGYPTPQ